MPSSDAVELPSSLQCNQHAAAIAFDENRLATLGVDREHLKPFVFREEDHSSLESEKLLHSSLEQHPLVPIHDRLALTVPTAVSAAVRRFALTELGQNHDLGVFAKALAVRERQHVNSLLTAELAKESTLISAASPSPHDGFPPISSWLLKYDRDKYLHVVLLPDPLIGESIDDLTSTTTVDDPALDAIRNYMTEVARRCESLSEYSFGLTLIIVGGLGHARAIPLPDTPDSWSHSTIRIADFSMLVDAGRAALDRYLKCIAQRRLAESLGIRFQAYDDYGFYCHWLENDCRAVPLDASFEHECLVVVPSNSPLPVRQSTRTQLDRHAARRPDGRWVTVLRLMAGSYFPYLQSRPVYASVEDARAHVLRGVVETDRGATWFSIVGHRNVPAVMHWFLQVWSGFIQLFDRLVHATEAIIAQPPADALEVHLDFGQVVMPSALEKRAGIGRIGAPTTSVDLEKRVVSIAWPEDFWAAFRGPSNNGETTVMRHVAEGLLALHGRPATDRRTVDALVRTVIPREGIRVIHLFEGHSFESLVEEKGETIELPTLADVGFLSPKLANGCHAGKQGGVLASRSECSDFLHKLVDKILGQMTQSLGTLDRTYLIRRLYGIHDGVLHDRDHWRRTSLALEAIHSTETDVTDVVRERENRRSQLGLAARCLLEVAICECPAVGGRPASRWDIDRLLAQAELLLQTATDSDAVHYGLVDPSITIHPNGEYDADRRFQQSVVQPFVSGYFDDKFQGDVRNYGTYYRSGYRGARKGAGSEFAEEFTNGFLAEYGLLPDETLSGFAELMDLAVVTAGRGRRDDT